MVAEVGRAALLIAFLLAIYAVIGGLVATRIGRNDLIDSVRRAVVGVFILVLCSAGLLIYSLVVKDYSLKFVANYTSNDSPVNYAVTSFWAGNAGSLLLWVLVLSFFSSIVVYQTRVDNRVLSPYVAAVQMGIASFFLLMINFLDNPFQRNSFAPPDGRGLNPLLENYWMQIHPPSLYLGYVTFSVPFAFAIAALLSGRLGDEWIKATRRWAVLAWVFLSLGNLLGAKWAYETLGWGGYWGWDPVENAAFMPWLTGTAYLHSVLIQERRGMLKVWNLVLIVTTFCLTIFGTFLVRSGILTSVHSFGLSELGPYFFSFLAFVVLGSSALIIKRLGTLQSENQLDSLLSRESSFLLNNLLLVGAAFAIFWGTVYPLISEAARGIKITVGTPYYDEVVGPILWALFLLMGIGPLIAWRRATVQNLIRNFQLPLLFAGVFLLLSLALGVREFAALLGFPVLGFATGAIVLEFYRGIRARGKIAGENIFTGLAHLFARNRRRYGGYVVHLGMVFIAFGVIGSKVYQDTTEAELQPGGKASIGRYTVEYRGMKQSATPTREVNTATLLVSRDGRSVGTLDAEKNFFPVQQQPQTVVGLRSTLTEDLYVVLANYQPDGRVTLKIYLNPLVSWIWIGGGVLLLGGVICYWPERQRVTRRVTESATSVGWATT